jgi:hypothetical protein
MVVSIYTLVSTNNINVAYSLLLIAFVLVTISVVIDVFVIERMRNK